ncbi:unnamed protein product [Rotaria sp. Silwood2]|nr:unnamed protein product [Rotaria sp. Silwood2]
MLSIILFLFISLVNTQYNYPKQQYPLNNFNSWSSFLPNYPTWNQGIQTNRASVRGNLLSDDTSVLPYGSQITVYLADVSIQDVAARPINTFVLYGSYRFPIAYEISYSIAQIQSNNNIQQYAIQARIEKDGQLLYINDRYTPVRLIPAPINPINVVMKKVGPSIYPARKTGPAMYGNTLVVPIVITASTPLSTISESRVSACIGNISPNRTMRGRMSPPQRLQAGGISMPSKSATCFSRSQMVQNS